VVNFINILLEFFVQNFGEINYKAETLVEKAEQFAFVQKMRLCDIDKIDSKG
jgi:hypothetical protein